MAIIPKLATFLAATVLGAQALDVRHSEHQRLRRGNVSTQSLAHIASADARMPLALQSMASECQCTFHGYCSCEQAMEFMNCIADACESGKCDCKHHHFLDACQAMDGTCPEADLQCSAERASCIAEPVVAQESLEDVIGDLEVMRMRKCRLEENLRDGWINAKLRIEELESKIEDRVAELQSRGVPGSPPMGCNAQADAEFEAWKREALAATVEAPKKTVERSVPMKVANEQPAAAQPTQAPMEWPTLPPAPPMPEVQAPSMPDMPSSDDIKDSWLTRFQVWKPCVRWMIPGCTPAWLFRRIFWDDVVYVIFVLLCALIYNKIRTPPKHVVQNRQHWHFVLPFHLSGRRQPVTSLVHQDFTQHLFGCCDHKSMFCFSCCCPWLRWADTMDKGRLSGMGYWGAFLLFFTLVILDKYTLGITGLIMIAVGVYFRQKMRKNYNIRYGTSRTICYDVCAWAFCWPCAIMQEAGEQAVYDQTLH